MKKILTLIVLISTGAFSFGQDMKLFRFGLKIAPGIYWDNPDNSKEYESSGARAKFSYGLISEIQLSKIIGIATGLEFNYTSFGINYKNPTYYLGDPNLVKKRIYSVNYIDIPATVKMKTPEIGAMTYFGQFGFNVSIRLKGKALDSKADAEVPDVNVSSELAAMQLGLNVGGGVEYNLAGSTSLLISLNYHNGFTSVLREESKYLFDGNNVPIKQNATLNFVSLNLGVLF